MQKLSYRDRVIVLVVLVAAIIVVGVVMFISPKLDDISSAEESLEYTKTQWYELETKLNQVDTITERVQTKYDECVEIGSLFVDIKRAYTLERFIQEYIDKNGIYITSSAAFTDPSIVTLEPYSLAVDSLDYEIGQSADLTVTPGDTQSKEEEKVENQSLPCGTITIDYSATRAGLMQFMQDIKESGKSIEITSITIGGGSYNTSPEAILTGDISISVYYAEMISDVDIGTIPEKTTEP